MINDDISVNQDHFIKLVIDSILQSGIVAMAIELMKHEEDEVYVDFLILLLESNSSFLEYMNNSAMDSISFLKSLTSTNVGMNRKILHLQSHL